MFVRPIGTRVEPADRPTGRPLLRGLLARAAGAGAAGSETPAPESGTAGAPTPEPRTSTAPAGTPHQGLAAELAQLANLAREGLLTPQEFKEAKTRLLHS
ncbi:SHOCT domain-containing protein [Streptomyces sp. NPDC051582]|uniref:SHOCT domain-containing protein n=1 Tax=Streptomyces sp. NPDC051582 TaxID=3155167 RepID=UPI003434CC6A